MVKSYSVTEPYKVQFILLVDTTQGEEEEFLPYLAQSTFVGI